MLGAGKPGAGGKYVSEDYVEHNPATPHDIGGIDGHRANIEQFREMLPDMRVELEIVVADDRYTAQLLQGNGTYEGEFMGGPPTGKPIEFMGAGCTEWWDEKMVEDWSVIDMLSIMQQLGVVDSPGEKQEGEWMGPRSQSKELERRFIEAASNEGDLAVLDEILAEDYVGHTSTRADALEGRSAMTEYIETTHSAFPDIELDLQDLVADGEWVASHWTATGTHEGALLGIEPTGNAYEAAGMEFTRIENGRIVEQWHVGDRLGMLQDLGIIPEESMPRERTGTMHIHRTEHAGGHDDATRWVGSLHG